MAEEGAVISCHSVDHFNEQMQQANASKKLVVIDFTASWCAPCLLMTPVLVDLAKRLPQVTFLKVDVDELKGVAQDWAIEAMPTFIFLREGSVIDKVVGARKEELQLKIKLHIVK